MVAAALTLGGSVRVGLEDNFYLPDGTMARSNGELIAKARQMTEDAGRRPATVAEARALLGIPATAARARMTLPLEGLKVLDLSRLLPGGFCSLLLADFGADVIKVEDTGLRRLRPLDPTVLRGRRGDRPQRPVPGAEPRQALDPARPEVRAGPRRAARAGARCRRPARVLPAGRARPARGRLRAAARRKPGARLLRDHRLRAGRSEPRPLGPRHELPRPERRARADRRGRRATGAGGRPDRRPRRRRADGSDRDHGRAARA